MTSRSRSPNPKAEGKEGSQRALPGEEEAGPRGRDEGHGLEEASSGPEAKGREAGESDHSNRNVVQAA